jgi:cell division protein FtsB
MDGRTFTHAARRSSTKVLARLSASVSEPIVVRTIRTSALAAEVTFFSYFRIEFLLKWCTSTQKRAILARSFVKKAPSAPRSSSTTAHRRGRRAIEYALLLIGCVVFVDALVGEKGLLETVKKRQEFKVLEESIRRARAENELLRQEAKRLRSDPTAIEDLARRELGLIRPGEHLFILKDRPESEGR